MKKYLTGAIALAFLSMSGLVSAQGTTSTTPATTPAATTKSTTTKVKHHKHSHKSTKSAQVKTETPKQ
jgi:hypothetical protein